jgi:Ca-activated chloride channel family protein
MKTPLFTLCIVFLAACSIDRDWSDGLADLPPDFPAALDGDDRYRDYPENPFLLTRDYPVSVFSVDADGASYANARRFIMEGATVPPASVRVEEFLNYFTYDYAEPSPGESVSLQSELYACPWADGHHLLRLGLKGKHVADADLPPANYVFLVDVSGSMSPADRLPLLKEGLALLVDALRPVDRVAIVTYGGRAGISLPSTPCVDKSRLKAEIARLGTKGATAGAAGIERAYEEALAHYIPGGNNRVILGTDGDFNVGLSSTDALVAMIRDKRASGIHLTVLGVGRGNLNDEMMEQLADNGNGNYEYIDSPRQLAKIFTEERARFYTVARDCKLRLTLDSTRVTAYRLIGYENRLLVDDQFADDRADAGEIGVDQTVTALYELILDETAPPAPAIATLEARYKQGAQSLSRLLLLTVDGAPVLSPSPDARFAAAVAGAAMILKRSRHQGDLSWTMVADLASTATTFDPGGHRADFLSLVAMLANRNSRLNKK